MNSLIAGLNPDTTHPLPIKASPNEDAKTGALQVAGSTYTPGNTVENDTVQYTAGDCVGNPIALTGAARVDQGTGVLQTFTIVEWGSQQKAPLKVLLFAGNPSGFVNNAPAGGFTILNNATPLAVFTIEASDYVTSGDSCVATIRNLGIPYVALNALKAIYAVLITTGTPTYPADSCIWVQAGVLQD